VKNPDAKDGYWVIQKTRQPIYARTILTVDARLKAANNLQERVK
jgi:hypothetical protein